MQSLVLIRGLPGSGKSTMAQHFVKAGFSHFEADMFHIINGVYQYKSENISDAHNWCQHQTLVALRHGENVVVANTFTRISEMYPYIHMATDFNVPVSIMVCSGEFKNIHNVPESVLTAMRKRWEN